MAEETRYRIVGKSYIPLENCLKKNKESRIVIRNSLVFKSGYQDSNLGPPAPKAGALPDCATSRTCYFRMRYIPKFGWTPGFEPGTLPILIGMRYRTALHPEKESPLARACGWGGIRTRGTSFPVRRFSKPVVSATHPPIRGLFSSGRKDTPAVNIYQTIQYFFLFLLLLLIQAQLQLLLQLRHGVFEDQIHIHHILYGFAGVDDGGVVAAAEFFADGFERFVGEFFSQVHG